MGEGQGKTGLFTFKGRHNFCSFPVSHNLVTWPHLAAGKTGKCDFCSGWLHTSYKLEVVLL